MKNGICILCFLFLAISAEAESPFSIEHSINSNFPEQERNFTIQLPESYFSQETYKYPVLVLLDGESNLDYTRSVSEFLADSAVMPEVIIVALHAGVTRERDYLPNNEQTNSGMTGDADQFLSYIEQELIPFVEAEYRAAPLRLLSGHSIGGVFVIYTMLKQPGIFQGYMAQSPYLADQALVALLTQQIETFGKQNPSLDKTFYMNLGDEPDLEQAFNQIQASLEAGSPHGFRLKVARNPGEMHMTTRLIGQYSGLQEFFSEDWALSQQQIVSAKAAGVIAHVEGLSEKYRYPVLYSEQTLSQATQIFLSQQDINSAAQVGEMFTKQYPNSAIAHFLLANVQGSSGNREAASNSVATAIKLYEENPSPRLAPLYAGMKQLEQQLNAN